MPPKRKEPPMANFGLMQYKRGSHIKINSYLRIAKSHSLRDTPTNANQGDHATMLRMIEDIDSKMILRPELEKYITLYRGTSLQEFSNVHDYDQLKAKEGKDLRWWAYTSTTTSRTILRKYTKGVQMEINTIPQTKLIDFRNYSRVQCQIENEVLLARGTKFHIDSVTRSADGQCAFVTVTLKE